MKLETLNWKVVPLLCDWRHCTPSSAYQHDFIMSFGADKSGLMASFKNYISYMHSIFATFTCVLSIWSPRPWSYGMATASEVRFTVLLSTRTYALRELIQYYPAMFLRHFYKCMGTFMSLFQRSIKDGRTHITWYVFPEKPTFLCLEINTAFPLTWFTIGALF